MEVIKFILFLQVAIVLAYGNFEMFNENIFNEEVFDCTESNAKIILDTANVELLAIANAEMNAIWNQQSDLKNSTYANDSARIFAKTASFKKSLLKCVKKVSLNKLKNQNYRRQFSKMGDIGIASLPSEKLKDFQAVMNKMVTTFTTAKVCHMENLKKPCELRLEPDLVKLMATNRNETMLKHYWTAWRNSTGAKIRPFFKTYVTLGNEAARLNGFTDKAQLWLDKYEMTDFYQHIESVWKEIQPLYLQLHAYVRRKLRERYGEAIVKNDQAIPAHLLGTMWADSWENIANFTLPFPGKHSPDVTLNMIEQNYTARKIFKLAEASFKSMGMNPMPDSFWNKSIFEKPTNREMICEPSAWDFYNGNDFRIRMCTTINANSLQRAHHEMGHIQYYMEYKGQPAVFRRGANPGFHEAIGDMISLSITTPKHLERIGLLKNYEHNEGASINHLYLKALELISNLPFAYIMDLYRWKIFQGEITSDNYNTEWWRLVKEFQGIKAPVQRTENDFDAAAKFHIVNDVEYIRYFISNVIQFQFHRALCIVAGDFTPNDSESKPLHQCDITSSPEAGHLLKSMLKLGSSKPWPYAMEVLTGTHFMNSSGLLDYFQPLRQWLEQENKKTNEYIGWK